MTHDINSCAQAPTLQHFGKVLDRLENHAERQASAMEELVRNTVILESQGKLIEKADHDLRELFGRVRIIEGKKVDRSDVAAIDVRVKNLEDYHNIEKGIEEVEEKKTKFWDDVKIQLANKLVLVGIFLLLAFDKLNIGEWLCKTWDSVFTRR
jgi:uncharacterized coiled-coil protein SlyX